MTAMISVQEGTSSRKVSKLEGVVLRQLQSALKGDDRSAMAVMKIATQLGILDEAADAGAETMLSPSDERILHELVERQGARRR